MGVNKRLVVGFLSVILLNSGLKAKPELDVERHQINGYDVYLIDSPVGNSVRIESFVPRGGFHDPAHLDGVSHYFEHVIHSGSENYPSRSRFSEVATENGAIRNASTGQGITRYYLEFHPEAFDTLIHLLGDMMTHPNFPEEELEREKAAVTQEITDYSQRAGMAFFAAFVHLLPEGHFLNKFITIGIPETVSRVTRDDILDIFLTDYRPENVKLVVAANFSGGEITKEQALKGIERSFRTNAIFEKPVPSHMTPAHHVRFEPLIGSNQAQLLELGTNDKSRTLSLMFDFPRNADVNELALELLFDYLRLRNEGSLADHLLKKGWISSQGAGDLDANDMKLMYVQWQLTEEGSDRRDKIIELLFSELHRISSEGLRDDEIEFLMNMNVSTYREAFQDRSAAVDFFKRFSILGVDHQEIFDLEKRFRSLSGAEISRMATFASPDSVLITHLDPRFEGEQSSTFHRAYRIAAIAPATKSLWVSAREQGIADHPCKGIETGKIPLRFSESAFEGEQGRKTFAPSEHGSKLFLLEEHGTRQGNFSVRLHTGHFSEEAQVALDLQLSSFGERYAAELTYLRNIGILRSLSTDLGSLRLDFKGDSQANQDAYQWLMKKIIDFEASDKELKRALEKLRVAAQSEEDSFTAQVAVGAARSGLSRKGLTTLASYQIASSDGFLNKTQKFTHDFFGAVTLRMGMVGDYKPEHLSELEAFTASVLPAGLSNFEPQREEFDIAAQVNFWLESSKNKKDGDYGGAMIIPGPEFLSREDAALGIIRAVLHEDVFRINRTEGELGYVHGFGLTGGFKRSDLLFYGGTSSKEAYEQMQRGWREAIVATRKRLTPEVFEATRRAVLLKRRIIPGNPSDRADRYIQAFFRNGDPDGFEKQTKQIASLSYEELMKSFDQYVQLKGNYFFTEVSKNPSCTAAIQDLAMARAALNP